MVGVVVGSKSNVTIIIEVHVFMERNKFKNVIRINALQKMKNKKHCSLVG